MPGPAGGSATLSADGSARRNEFLLPGDGDPSHIAARIVETTSGRATPQVRRTRRWYDTFDWRLHRAGLALEISGIASSSTVVLSRREGGAIASAPAPAVLRF